MKNLIITNISYILKMIIVVITMIILSWYAVDSTFAAEKTAYTSARLAMPEKKIEDKRAELLKKYLEKYDSPLAPHAGKFIEEADKNDLDWKLLVSIAGVESYFGHQIPPYSNNAWGWGVYNGKVHNFASWDEGITEISYELKTRYMDKWGAKDVYEIGKFYAADPNWANKVTHFMEDLNEFAKEDTDIILTLSI